MKKNISFLLVCIFTITLCTTPVSATKSLSELEKEKKNISGDIKDTQKQLSGTQAEMAAVQAEIEDLDNKLTVTLDELDTINQTLTDTEVLLTQAEQALEQAQADRDSQFEAFKTRLRVMQEYGSASFLAVLFQATSIRNFLTRLEYINTVARYDNQMIERMQQAEDKVSVKVEDMARQKNTIEAMQYMQTVKTDELQAALADREAYFDKLDADEQLYQAKLDQQKESEKVIQAAYEKQKAAAAAAAAAEAAKKRASQSNVKYNGIMLWPVPVYKYISDYYGGRINPINKKKETHTGVDIASPMGSDILAADTGTVILARYNGGYGNCVIIDHGGGISTLYGHASKLLVSDGQKVKKGDVIAKIGSTGQSTGPHLHFEVRINGNHTNPKAYLNY